MGGWPQGAPRAADGLRGRGDRRLGRESPARAAVFPRPRAGVVLQAPAAAVQVEEAAYIAGVCVEGGLGEGEKVTIVT